MENKDESKQYESKSFKLMELDEMDIAVHNIACAVSVLAGIKGIQPHGDGTDKDMEDIIENVKMAYSYSMWHINRYGRGQYHEHVDQWHSTTSLWEQNPMNSD